MTNPSKRKGNDAEHGAANWIAEHRGLVAKRPPAGAPLDAGDLVISTPTGQILPWHIDVKNRQRWNVEAWMRELTAEAAQQSTEHLRMKPLLILKRAGIGNQHAGRWLAVVHLEDLEL